MNWWNESRLTILPPLWVQSVSEYNSGGPSRSLPEVKTEAISYSNREVHRSTDARVRFTLAIRDNITTT